MSTASPSVYPAFSADLEIEPVSGEGGKRRFALYHPGRDTTCVLGEAELKVAQLFDGRRSLEDIAARARDEHRLRLSVEQLRRFEERLRGLRVLSAGGEEPEEEPPQSGMLRAARVDVGRGAAIVVPTVRLFSVKPDRLLDALISRVPFLVRRSFVLACAALLAVAAVLLVRHAGELASEAPLVLRGWGWALLFFVIGLQGVFHEGGHALSCKAFGVRVNEIGLATYFFLLTAWTRPIQSQWDRLPKPQRLWTIMFGPFGSLVFGALGVLLWRMSPDGSLGWRLGLLAVLSTPLTIVPTMLPVFDGDGYLLLTEYFEKPGIRSRSWAYLRERIAGKPRREVSPAEARLYLFVSLGTAVGLFAVWVAALSALAFVVSRELHP